jgi:hypothetical protein
MISSMFKKNFIAGAKTEVSGLEIPDANIATVRSSVHIPFRYKSLAICTHFLAVATSADDNDGEPCCDDDDVAKSEEECCTRIR